MKPNNSGDDMWLRAQTANEKLKEDAQTQDAAGMQDMSVFTMAHTGYISTIICFMR